MRSTRPKVATGANSRNEIRTKTVLTHVGEVDVDVPRDREGTFEPQIVRKRQRRLAGVDELVISLSAKGLTHGEISAHLGEGVAALVLTVDEVAATTYKSARAGFAQNPAYRPTRHHLSF